MHHVSGAGHGSGSPLPKFRRNDCRHLDHGDHEVGMPRSLLCQPTLLGRCAAFCTSPRLVSVAVRELSGFLARLQEAQRSGNMPAGAPGSGHYRRRGAHQGGCHRPAEAHAAGAAPRFMLPPSDAVTCQVCLRGHSCKPLRLDFQRGYHASSLVANGFNAPRQRTRGSWCAAEHDAEAFGGGGAPQLVSAGTSSAKLAGGLLKLPGTLGNVLYSAAAGATPLPPPALPLCECAQLLPVQPRYGPRPGNSRCQATTRRCCTMYRGRR